MAELFSLQLRVEKTMVKEAVKAVVGAILFHRVFGTIQPKAVDILDLSFPAIDDDEIERTVEERSQAFARHVDAGRLQKSQLAVIFLEKKAKTSWWSKAEESVPWEQWSLTIEIIAGQTERERNRIRETMEAQLETCLWQIIKTVNEKKEHIPPIVTNEANPFPYQIVLPTDGGEGWVGSVLKKLIESQ